jgi:hypothetical protein
MLSLAPLVKFYCSLDLYVGYGGGRGVQEAVNMT